MIKILVFSGSVEAANNLKRMVPAYSQSGFRYDFIEVDDCDLSDRYDGMIAFHKSSVVEEMQIKVGVLGATFFFMEPNTQLSYVNKEFIDQFDVSYNVQDFPFKTNAIQLNFNISTLWLGLRVSIVDGNHVLAAKPDFTSTFFENIRFAKKRDAVSIIAPTKQVSEGHRIRDEVIYKYADDLDVFGYGHRALPDKMICLEEYRYHVAVENCSQNGYFTEKLIDCFVAETYPIYWGAPDVSDFFPSESFLPLCLDLNPKNFGEFIGDRSAMLRHDALLEAKQLSLNRYNPFNVYEQNAGCFKFENRVVALRPVRRGLSSRLRARLNNHAFY